MLLLSSSIDYSIAQATRANKLSAELNLGLTLKKDTNQLTPLSFFNGEVALRYMFNSKHGLKLDVGVNSLKRDINFSSFTKTFLVRYSLQYVLDVGRWLHFENFAPKFSTLIHLGGGYSSLRYNQSRIFKSWKNNQADERINLIIGISPQYKINRKVELHTDVSYVGNFYQDFNKGFKWSDLTKKSSFGNILNFNVGATYYIGKNTEHSDWKFKKIIKEEFIPKTETKDSAIVVILDTDKDGVLDSVDFCPEVFGLVDFDGCPKPEISYDCTVDEYPIFTFRGAHYNFNPIYQNEIDAIVNCLKININKKIIIYGHTDNFGADLYKEELSLNRAKEIKNQLVQRGIKDDRIFAVGEGPLLARIADSLRIKIGHNRVAYIKTISNNNNDLRVLKTGEFLQGLVFSVQIGSFKSVIKNNKFDKYGEILVTKTDDGFMRYMVGRYLTYEEAYEKWKSLRNIGLFQDSFVTAYFLGEKITIKQAQALQSQRQK